MKRSIVPIILFAIFFASNNYNKQLLADGVSLSFIAGLNFIGILCLLVSFIVAFASVMFWEVDRETKAFSLIFVGLSYGVLLPGFLLPLMENINSIIPFYVELMKNIALFSSAGCAGSLFAISAEIYSTNKISIPHKDKCECLSSREEVVKLSTHVTKLTKLLYIALFVQLLLILFLFIK